MTELEKRLRDGWKINTWYSARVYKNGIKEHVYHLSLRDATGYRVMSVESDALAGAMERLEAAIGEPAGDAADDASEQHSKAVEELNARTCRE